MVGRRVSVFIFLLVVLAIVVGYFFSNRISYKNPELAAENQARVLAAKVEKLVRFSQTETPTVATVTDPKMLKDQVFFAEAKKGDQVLIYPSSKKAVLYDPVENKIINMASVNIGDVERSLPRI